MRRCRAAIRARGCKGRHEKEAPVTEPFRDRQEFRNFIRLGPEPAVPASDSAALGSDAAGLASTAEPPWEPATEPVDEPPLWAAGSAPAPPPLG
jgi:hypothetical protein